MKLLIDIGKGTEDILLKIDDIPLHNAIQVVVPSMAQLLAKLLRKDTSDHIFIDGDLIAGEPWHKEIYRIAKTKSVYMTINAARSLKYNLSRVENRKIIILDESDFGKEMAKHGIDLPSEIHGYHYKLDSNSSYYHLSDINWERLFHIIQKSLIKIEDISKVLVCCQDHGEPPNSERSVRDFRIERIYGPLSKRSKLEDLIRSASEIPLDLPRHQSITKSILRHFPHLKSDDIFLMDSSPAVILGAIDYFEVNNMIYNQRFVINLGNGHTLIVFLDERKVMMIYEIHTSGVDPKQLVEKLRELLSGRLTHEKVIESGGHGIFSSEEFDPYTEAKIDDILEKKLFVLGPNRSKLSELNVEFINPGGSMMMAGPLGLLYAYNRLNL